jgi:hypothetical protein
MRIDKVRFAQPVRVWPIRLFGAWNPQPSMSVYELPKPLGEQAGRKNYPVLHSNGHAGSASFSLDDIWLAYAISRRVMRKGIDGTARRHASH